MHDVSLLRRIAVLAAGLSALVALSQPCWADEADFAVALDAAKKAAEVEPLKSYLTGPFKGQFGAHYIEWLNECAVKTNQTSDELIELLVTVGRTGNVEAVRYRPHSKTTDCFVDSLKAVTFPAPPQPGLAIPAVIRTPK